MYNSEILPDENSNDKRNEIQQHNAQFPVSGRNLDFCYPFIVDAAQEGILVLNVQGEIVHANTCMAELLGTTAEMMLDKSISDFLFEGDDMHVVNLAQSNPTISNKPYECRYRQVNGQERLTTVAISQVRGNDGNVLAIVAMHTDITERKNIENALQNSLQNMGIILDSVKDYAIMMIDIDRRVLSWNKGAEAIFGYKKAEITGQLIDIFFTPEDRKNNAPEAELEGALQNGHSFDDRWHLRKDGSRFFASGVSTRLNQDEGPQKFIKIARDIAESKEMEKMMKKADRHKNEFLATLAHELRNPLASILSGIEILSQDGNEKNKIKTQEVISRQTQQMIHLVNDLLDISRISLGKIKINRQPINLMDPIHLALETSRPIIEGYKHVLTVSLPGGPVVVDGDTTRLSQVFLNILINCAKYTAPAGQITFTVYLEKDEVVARIRDNGMGIPHHMLSSIFEMFEQIQDRSEYPQAGLGIGLSVVKQLVEMHDGQVEAHSEGSNKGSEFVVRLPVYQHDEERQKEKILNGSPAKAVTPSIRKKILLVDDNADAADMMEILLTKKGYIIRKAYDGKTGIATALEFDPEIVLLDLGLPDISGYEVLKALQAKLGNRFYLALSGWGQEEDIRKSEDAGFAHHLVKPIDIQSLDDVLSSAT